MDFRELYDQNVGFVWRALRRLGVAPSDLPDAAQEVFLVAHRKLAQFEGRSKMTSWLFGICMRVASDRRRSDRRRLSRTGRALATADGSDLGDSPSDPTALVDQQRARQMLGEIMDLMSEEQRIVFALFELEEMPGEEIAELLSIPVGTVRSRLRLARETFTEAIRRLQARERGCLIAHSLAREV